MPDDAEKRNWLKKVLGIDFAGEGAGEGAGAEWKPGAPLMPIWLDAKETIDAGIGQLQSKLREIDDEDMQQIAEYGLFGVTQGETVQLMAALRDAEGGGEAARRRMVAAVHSYQDFIEGASIVELIETNPFGVAVPMRRTLGAALRQLEALAAG